MLKVLKQYLPSTVKASFTTPYSLDESIRRLAVFVDNEMPFFSFVRPIVVGSVSIDRVVLRCYRPLQSRWGRPVFQGIFSNKDGTTVLDGSFSIGRFFRFVYSAWFAVLFAAPLFAMLVGLDASHEQGAGIMMKILMVVSSFMFGLVAASIVGLLGVGILRLMKSIADRDTEFISETVRQCFGKHNTEQPHAPDRA